MCVWIDRYTDREKRAIDMTVRKKESSEDNSHIEDEKPKKNNQNLEKKKS